MIKAKSVDLVKVYEAPATTWDEVIDRYSLFVGLISIRASGEESSFDSDVARARMQKARTKLADVGPSAFGDAQVQKLFPKGTNPKANNPQGQSGPSLLWRALIHNRCNYTCHFCRRNAFAVFNERQYTLRLHLDHAKTRALHGGTFDFDNMRTACRSCNEIRGQLDEHLVWQELHSLSKAVLALNPTALERAAAKPPPT